MIPKSAGQERDVVVPRVVRRDDAAKALVLSMIERLVRRGFAKRCALDNGDVEVRFHSGEVFLLGETDVTRIR